MATRNEKDPGEGMSSGGIWAGAGRAIGAAAGIGAAGGVWAAALDTITAPAAISGKIIMSVLRLVIVRFLLEFLSGRLRGRYILVPDVRAQYADLEQYAFGFQPLA